MINQSNQPYLDFHPGFPPISLSTPIPKSQEQLENPLLIEQSFSATCKAVYLLLRLFLMYSKDYHAMTSPPMKRMMRKIDKNSFSVLSNFFVPGTILAIFYL
jgi:hypothetical protein